MRWFRDIPSPSDDVPVSLALSDANHAVSLTKELMGPGKVIISSRHGIHSANPFDQCALFRL